MRESLLTAVVSMVVGVPLLAQSERISGGQTLDSPVGQELLYVVDSGLHSNPTFRTALLWSHRFSDPSVAWTRVFFGSWHLPGDSFVRITSLEDGASADMGAELLREWDGTSAYFNGSRLLLELFVGPGEIDVHVTTTHLTVQEVDHHHEGPCGICGPDARQPSAQDWAGRILNSGCTGSVWSIESCVVTAGHCARAASVIQFRVPASNADCTLNHPPPEDQFPITGSQFRDGGVGDDWAVLTTGINNVKEKAFERYGVLMPIANHVPSANDWADVWGYGIDDPCDRNQVQQDSNGGPILTVGAELSFEIDVTFGNSGSAVVHNQAIVGIVTHCSMGCPNYGTRIDLPSFVAARDAICDGCSDTCVEPAVYGRGSSGTLGYMPELDWNRGYGCPFIDNGNFRLEVRRFYGGIPGFMLMGFSSTNDNSLDFNLLVDVFCTPPGLALPVSYEGVGPGNGVLNVDLEIPDDPTLDGFDVFFQFLGFDQVGIAASNGLHVKICQ